MNKRISPQEREKDFLGPEGAVFVEYPDKDGSTIGVSSSYIPTPMSQVKKQTGISIFDITEAKLRGGMYPWQQKLAQILGLKKDQ